MNRMIIVAKQKSAKIQTANVEPGRRSESSGLFVTYKDFPISLSLSRDRVCACPIPELRLSLQGFKRKQGIPP
jgi:hypothetical protein